MGLLLQPVYKGKETLTGPAFSFLIEHDSGKRIVFDLGVRKNWETLPTPLVKRIKDLNWKVQAEEDVATILTDSGVDVHNGGIDAVVWSHQHWDHIGDMATFPKSVPLVVGPGVQEEYLPGWPDNESSTVPAEDFKGRTVREIEFSEKPLKIGRFNAFDYFGDGSFYLLDTPGHTVGHLCGLARTTSSPPSFIFMGGDACHHGGEFRPSEYLPLPKSIDPSPMKKLHERHGGVCPGHLLQQVHFEQSANKSYYLVKKSFAHDLEQCNWTIEGLQEFDAQDNVLMVLAHDDSVLDVLDFFPKEANDWHSKELAQKSRWRFLKDFETAATLIDEGRAKPEDVWEMEEGTTS